MNKIATILTVILAFIGFSFCLSSIVHADMMSPSNPASPTNITNPSNPASPLNPSSPASPLNPANMNMEQDEEEHVNSNSQVSDGDERVGAIIAIVGSIAIVVTVVFLIIQAS